MDYIRQHKAVAVGGLLVVAAGAWYFFTGSGSVATTSVVTTQTVDATDAQSVAQKDILDSLLTLRAIHLDGAIFNDPGFQGLRDFSTQIVSEPVGRPNPFAPLDGTSTKPTAPNKNEPSQLLRTH